MDIIGARHLSRSLGAKSITERLKRASTLLEYLVGSVQLPTRVATHFGENKAGVAFIAHTFNATETERLGKLLFWPRYHQ